MPRKNVDGKLIASENRLQISRKRRPVPLPAWVWLLSGLVVTMIQPQFHVIQKIKGGMSQSAHAHVVRI